MPYHGIGSGEYQALGLDYPLPDIADLRDVSRHACLLTKMGVDLVEP